MSGPAVDPTGRGGAGRVPLPEEIVRWRKEGRDDLFRRWEERLADTSVSRRLVEAVRPVLRQWVEAKHREPTYFLTQLLTGHGCFGRYLCEVVGIESDPGCRHCATGAVDTAEHTLAVCTAWDAQRATLTGAIGRDLSLPAVVRSMAGSEQSWAAVASFAREVMAAKREALRERERASETLPPRRAPARGRRRTRYAAALQPT
ncbi:uncharacterized protein LOC123723141 [Papilio machaon]|uniref:uncharacterized protein LOC123723141 n=1 Tax=Papilio machaon TaxID=76193 RepID=UPI001E665E5D|nr:uncharacterized protein LOC123723141 [Papilio machaon]